MEFLRLGIKIVALSALKGGRFYYAKFIRKGVWLSG